MCQNARKNLVAFFATVLIASLVCLASVGSTMDDDNEDHAAVQSSFRALFIALEVVAISSAVAAMFTLYFGWRGEKEEEEEMGETSRRTHAPYGRLGDNNNNYV